jgi:hypothetical protein
MHLQQVIHTVNEIIENMLQENAKIVSADKLNLDPRCGKLYVGKNFIAVEKYSNGSLRYYGGFEYVDENDIVHINNYVIYQDNSDRVYDAIEFFNHNHSERV